MDPQLEEYRRKQREKQQAQATGVAQQAQKSSVSLLLGIALVGATAVAYFQFAGDESMGSALAVVASEEAPARRTAGAACPVLDGPGACVEACSGDGSCPTGQLCCSNGCGHECMDPVDDSTPAPARRCAIIAVVGKEHFATVLETIPEPKGKQELKGIGMLILEYGKGNDAVCCEAADALKGHSLVSSVEFDGRPPPCAKKWALPKQAPGPEDTMGVDDAEAAQMEEDGFVGMDVVEDMEVGMDAVDMDM